MKNKKKWLLYYWSMFILIISYQIVYMIYPIVAFSNSLWILYIIFSFNILGWYIFMKLWDISSKYYYIFFILLFILISINVYLNYNGHLSKFKVQPRYHYLPLLFFSYFFYKDKRINYLYGKVKKYQNESKVDKAISYLNKLYKIYPDDLYYFSYLGYLYSVKEDYNNILINFAYVIKSFSNINLNDSDQDNVENISYIYYYYAEAYFNSDRNYIESLKYYTEAYNLLIKLEKKDDFSKNVYFKILFNIAICHSHIGNHTNSLNFYNKYLEESKQSNYYIDKNHFNYCYAFELYKNKDYKRAEIHFLKLIEEGYPEDKLWNYKYLIEVYNQIDKQEKKWKYLIEATNKKYNFIDYYDIDPNILNQEEKEKLYNHILKTVKGLDYTIHTYTTLVYLLFLNDRDREAKSLIEKMAIKFADNKYTFYWQIVYCLRNNLYEKAHELYKRILLREPKFIDEYNWIEVKKSIQDIRNILE